MTYYHWLGRKAEKYHSKRMSPSEVSDLLHRILAGKMARLVERDGFTTEYPKL